jgi:hypothetical protein
MTAAGFLNKDWIIGNLRGYVAAIKISKPRQTQPRVEKLGCDHPGAARQLQGLDVQVFSVATRNACQYAGLVD